MDSRDRAETLDQFLDHAALVADADDYDARAQITLMSLHAAKGLEFPLVFLSGLEEGLFPHSRTMLVPEDIEEERRLCYVGMTRAMDQLILTRAVYRRRYGTDLPEASVPSRFLEEVPAPLIEELGSGRRSWRDVRTRPSGGAKRHRCRERATHYSYEDEDQSAAWQAGDSGRDNAARRKPTAPARPYNSIENIAEFFASRGKKFTVPKACHRRAHRQARIPSRPEGSPSQIRRRHGLPARRRRRRSQDYGTIPSLRIEEAGGEVCPAGRRIAGRRDAIWAVRLRKAMRNLDPDLTASWRNVSPGASANQGISARRGKRNIQA